MISNKDLKIGLLKKKYPNGIQYLIERFRRPYPTDINYIRRLDDEYKIIRDKGFVKTFHRVCDLIDLIKQKEIIHVLRGSAASSLVCYQLGISDIDPIREKKFVVFHDAYQYFEKDFGISASGAISLGDASDPSPARLSEIRKRVVDEAVECVLAEPQYKQGLVCLLYTSPSPRDRTRSRMPSSA